MFFFNNIEWKRGIDKMGEVNKYKLKSKISFKFTNKDGRATYTNIDENALDENVYMLASAIDFFQGRQRETLVRIDEYELIEQ
jgi:5-hydroxyisourate hydrolase-like protein (transthyretin family)